jgi:hypothetical protein
MAAPGSRSAARVRSPLESEHPDRIGWALYEANHVGSAYDAVEAAINGQSFDVVHDHSGFTAVAMAPASWFRSCIPCTRPLTRRRARTARSRWPDGRAFRWCWRNRFSTAFTGGVLFTATSLRGTCWSPPMAAPG